MDQIRIGSFLKELRKEKALTQEQLAEHFGVSGRTVSRWENGNNMPDISILVEIADFYDVDIRELIDGERKSETMNGEMKDTLVKVADYSETTNKKKTVRIVVLMSLVCAVMLLSLIIVSTYLSLTGQYVGFIPSVIEIVPKDLIVSLEHAVNAPAPIEVTEAGIYNSLR